MKAPPGKKNIIFKNGVRSTPNSKRSDSYEQVEFSLITDKNHPAGVLRVDLRARRDGNDLVFGNRSSVQFNGMILLRGELGPHTCGDKALDGNTNVVGNQHHGESLTKCQIGLLVEAVRRTLDELHDMFPTLIAGKMWLKRAEACRDLPISDATRATRILQHATLSGSIARQHDEYRRVSCRERQSVPTLSFFSTDFGPINKVYPKRFDTLRLEVPCKDRRSVVMLLNEATPKNKRKGGKGSSTDKKAEFSAAGAEQLFLNFLNAAIPRLNQLEAHVKAALAGEASIGQLLTALISLLDRAAGHQKRKGPPSPDAQDIAIEAIEALLSGGMFDCVGAHARTAIRKDLDGLCSDIGPLSKHPHRAIYYLKPQFARACGKMRGFEEDD
jgi:hypothetical protein